MGQTERKYSKNKKRCTKCNIVFRGLFIAYKTRVYCMTCGSKIEVSPTISIGEYISAA